MNQKPILGLFVAPLVGALVYLLLVLIVGDDNSPKQDYSGFKAWPFFAGTYVFVAIILYILSIFAGIPFIKFLKNRGKLTFWRVLSGSIVIVGVASSAVVYYILRGESNIAIGVIFIGGYGAITGAATAITYCWFAGITSHSKTDAASGAV